MTLSLIGVGVIFLGWNGQWIWWKELWCQGLYCSQQRQRKLRLDADMLEFDNIYRRNAVSVNIPIPSQLLLIHLNYWNLSAKTSYINTSVMNSKTTVLHWNMNTESILMIYMLILLKRQLYSHHWDTTRSSNIVGINPLPKPNTRFYSSMTRAFEPGYINLYFPDKTRFLWSSVIPILTLSVLFTGLILFCFSYTIYIIFRQKKVSEMKTDFINNMTHEFKTSIATISLGIGLYFISYHHRKQR